FQRLPPCGFVLREYHLPHSGDSITFKEHMLRPAKSYAFRTKFQRLQGILRCVGVCTNLHRTAAVDPLHKRAKIATEGGLNERLLTRDHFSRRPIDRNPVALLDGCLSAGERPITIVDYDVAAACHAGLSPPTGYDGGVR